MVQGATVGATVGAQLGVGLLMVQGVGAGRTPGD